MHTAIDQDAAGTLAESSPNSDLMHFLNGFCSTDATPKYAVLLTGPWGSGKSWFIEGFRSQFREKRKTFYVSLFGVSKVSDITDQFFAQLHPTLSDRKVQRAFKLLKGFLKGSVKIDLDGDGKEDGTIAIDGSALEKWANVDGSIIIFDDLERVTMPLNDILGYINQFVEHDNYRVILVANETKLLGKESGFSGVKEKVIGRSFQVQPETKRALHFFLKELGEGSALNTLREGGDIVLDVYSRAGHTNLRQLRQAIHEFSTLWNCLGKGAFSENAGFKRQMLEDVLTISIELRAGIWDVQFIRNYENLVFQRALDRGVNNQPEIGWAEDPKFTALKRHRDVLDKSAIPLAHYAHFFESGFLSAERVSEALDQSHFLLNSNTPSWRLLWSYTVLSDADFVRLAQDVFGNLKNGHYQKAGEFVHVVATLLRLSGIDLIEPTTETIKLEYRRQLPSLFEQIESNNDSKDDCDLRDGIAYGLMFHDRSSEAFIEFKNCFEATRKESVKKLILKRAPDWMRLISDDNDVWCEHLLERHGVVSWFAHDSVFDGVSAKEFCNAVVKLSAAQLANVSATLNERYKYISPNNDWLLLEIPFWHIVKRELDKLQSTANATPKTLSIYILATTLLPTVDGALKILEAYKLRKVNATPE